MVALRWNDWGAGSGARKGEPWERHTGRVREGTTREDEEDDEATTEEKTRVGEWCKLGSEVRERCVKISENTRSRQEAEQGVGRERMAASHLSGNWCPRPVRGRWVCLVTTDWLVVGYRVDS